MKVNMKTDRFSNVSQNEHDLAYVRMLLYKILSDVYTCQYRLWSIAACMILEG